MLFSIVLVVLVASTLEAAQSSSQQALVTQTECQNDFEQDEDMQSLLAVDFRLHKKAGHNSPAPASWTQADSRTARAATSFDTESLQPRYVAIAFALVACLACAAFRTPSEDESGKASGYRPDIDGLRAISITMVFIYHLEKTWLTGGFLGVDIFFVISGFVVTQSILGRGAAEGIFVAYSEFYTRRVKRLMPASLFMISVASLCIPFIYPPWSVDLMRCYSSGQLALIGWSNNYFASMKTSYWDNGLGSLESNPFTHTWSLCVEEQFYFVFPLILTLAYGASWKTNASHDFQLRHGVVLCLVLGSSLLIACIQSQSDANVAFFTLPSRLWEMALGALLFEVQSSCAASGINIESNVTGWASILLQVLAFCFIGYSTILCENDAAFSLPMTLMACFGAACFIGAGCMPHAYLNGWLSHWSLVHLGKISYPLYLFHWPVIVFCKMTYGIEPLYHKLACVVVSVALASFAYHAVEGPFRKWRPSRRGMVFLLACCGIITLQCWMFSLKGPLDGRLWVQPDYPPQPPSSESDAAARILASPHASHCSRGCSCRLVDTTWHTPPCAQSGPNATDLPPCFVEFPVTSLRFILKYSSTNTATIEEAPEGEEAVPEEDLASVTASGKHNTVYIFGDSHSKNVLPAMEGVAARLKPGRLKVKNYGRGGCWFGPWTTDYKDYFGGDWEEGCKEHFKKATAEMAESLIPGDLVVISNSPFPFVGDVQCYWSNCSVRATPEWISNYSVSLENLHTYVSARGAKMLLFGFSPFMMRSAPGPLHGSFLGSDCVPTLFRPDNPNKCEIPKESSRAASEPVKRMLRNLAKTKLGVFFYDHHDLFCNSDTCGPFVPGTKTLAIRDESHFTRVGSRYMIPYISFFLERHGVLRV